MCGIVPMECSRRTGILSAMISLICFTVQSLPSSKHSSLGSKPWYVGTALNGCSVGLVAISSIVKFEVRVFLLFAHVFQHALKNVL